VTKRSSRSSPDFWTPASLMKSARGALGRLADACVPRGESSAMQGFSSLCVVPFRPNGSDVGWNWEGPHDSNDLPVSESRPRAEETALKRPLALLCSQPRPRPGGRRPVESREGHVAFAPPDGNIESGATFWGRELQRQRPCDHLKERRVQLSFRRRLHDAVRTLAVRLSPPTMRGRSCASLRRVRSSSLRLKPPWHGALSGSKRLGAPAVRGNRLLGNLVPKKGPRSPASSRSISIARHGQGKQVGLDPGARKRLSLSRRAAREPRQATSSASTLQNFPIDDRWKSSTSISPRKNVSADTTPPNVPHRPPSCPMTGRLGVLD